MRRIPSVLLCLFPLTCCFAQDFPTLLFFTDDKHDKIRLIFQDGTQLVPANECGTEERCKDLYWLERRVRGGERIAIVNVRLDPLADSPTLELTAARPVQKIDDLVLVAADLQIVNPDTGLAKSAGWKEFPVAPQLGQNPAETDAVITYQSITPITLVDSPRLRSRLSSNITAVDEKEFGRRYDVFVSRIDPVGDDPTKPTALHDIYLTGVPRGKALKLTLKGVEQFGGTSLQAKTTVELANYPKGRDDAVLYANISAEAAAITDERKYKFDTRIDPTWTFGKWEIGPTLDAVIGNKTSKAPNTASLSTDFRYWPVAGGPGFTQAFLVAPIYRTDRAMENRDFGLDLVWEPFFSELEDKTLEQRRKDYKRAGGPALAIRWGYRLRPSLGAEVGRHIESSSADVEDQEFTRARMSVAAMVERLNVRLSITAQFRYLFNDEVFLDPEHRVIRTSRDDRTHIRSELSYDLGFIALTLTHLKGELPPAFSETDSLSFGFAFKY